MSVIYTSKDMDEEHIEEFKRRNGIPENVRVVNIESVPPEERTKIMKQIRDTIRDGQFTIPPHVEAKMEEEGVSRNDILSALLNEIGRDS